MSPSTLASLSGRASSTARTWLLSGVPRSGTSLCCRLAGELPDMVALSEPIRYPGVRWHGQPAETAAARIRDFAKESRGNVSVAERRAPTVQFEGRLDDNRIALRT